MQLLNRFLNGRYIIATALTTVTMLALVACQPLQQMPEASVEGSVETTAEEADTTADDAMDGEKSDAEMADAESESMLIEVEFLPAEQPPFSTNGWDTDFSQRTVEWDEILSGGPPKDGIPSVDEPTFESVDAASERLSPQDPVIVYEHNGDARAYPLSILIWHEIVNDEVGGKPVSVTFCPLCNASIVFDRAFADMILDFGTTGRLRKSDLIMYDRQTETWWQQFTGQGIIGEFAGQELTFLASQVLSYGDFAAEFPDGQVMAIPAFRRQYGVNPYARYDSTTDPFLFRGEIDTRLPATERVVGVEVGDSSMAYSFSEAAEAGVINDQVADTSLVIFHKSGTASALDSAIISEGRDIGSIGVFNRQLGDQLLTFESLGGGLFTDAETGSTWNILGQAIEGDLAGQELDDVISFDHFWFAWAAFFPDTGLYQQ